MAKPEWGAKRACPKCGTRFYDLGKDDPVTCINCGAAWAPEPILKSKQPSYEAAPQKVAAAEAKPDADLGGEEELEGVDEDAEINPDEEVDLGTGDDDLGVVSGDKEEEI